MKCPFCKKDIPVRSSGHNAYYWQYLTLLEDETGNEKEQLHQYFKRIFLPPKEITVLGKTIKIPGSTTELDPYGMSMYIRKIEVETGILAPSYDTQTE